MFDNMKTDVLICGGGPVGLLLSYQLARMDISTLTVEQYDKSQQAMYGRASTLYPRTSEMLDQLDLNDALSQIGYIGRGSVVYKDGKKIQGRGWDFISRMHDTYFDYCLNIRQKYSENVFREKLMDLGGVFASSVTLKSFEIDENAADGYKVTSTLADADGNDFTVKSKYIVGADGGRSTVRKLAGIPFVGERTKHHWIRIDGIFKTNMPDARVGFGAIESPTHGNVLWVALDHGRTRIGFALSPEMYAKYGDNITEEDVKREATKSMAPFELEFETVDWWTLYSIGQRVAESFRSQNQVLLAGDACHTHSSGAAQGMNTGMHDAVNLGWKLAGVLKGWYTDDVLETYGNERRPVAQKLIDLDKTISTLISGVIPKDFVNTSTSTDPNEILNNVLESSAQFTIGLGVHYQNNILNKEASVSSVTPGWRGPDVLVRRPGVSIPLRLQSITKNYGKFWILVFAGSPLLTAAKLQSFRSYLDDSDSFTKRLTNTFNFMTIIAGHGLQPDEVLGVDRFGDAFYDLDESAHHRYGISREGGGIVVLRPDGIVGCAVGLNEGSKIGAYFEQFVAPIRRE
jgi:phenol 2-monooxygenase